MSGAGTKAVLAICIACIFGFAFCRSAMAISTLSDKLENLPDIFRTPSSEPPNNAVHRDFEPPSSELQSQTRDVGPGPEGSPVTVPAASAQWTVAIADGPQLDRDFVCAGALVAAEWVLTAAHCTYTLARRWPNDNDGYVFVESASLSKPGRRFAIREIVPHPEYNPKSLRNDLALVRFGGKDGYSGLPISIYGQPIAEKVGEIGSILGWGVSESQSGREHSERLHVIQTAVIDGAVCFSAANFPELRQNHVFCGRSLLAYHDICFRFGGSPMVFYDHNARLYLGGIVSWPAGCGESRRRVNIYLDVQSYVPWIKSVIGDAAK
jgi:secreted trypsin-like serine protease